MKAQRDEVANTGVGDIVNAAACDDVTVEANASWPNSFAKNVRQLLDGAFLRSGIYRDTVRSETVNPSFPLGTPWVAQQPP